jgi:hypothetical protein
MNFLVMDKSVLFVLANDCDYKVVTPHRPQ